MAAVWHVEATNAGCGPDAPCAVIDDADGSVVGCYPDQAAADAAVADLVAAASGAPAGPVAGGYRYQDGQFAAVVPGPPVTGAPADMPMPAMGDTVAWAGVLAVEGIPTGDRAPNTRQFTLGAFTWPDLPIPLRWQVEDTHGGVLVNGTVLIGRIDTITRVGAEIHGTGVIDTGSADGAEAARRMGTPENPGFLAWISVDADDPENGLVDYVMPAGCDTGDPAAMDDAEFERCMSPELTVFHSGRIRAATLCDISAWTQARIYLTEPMPAIAAASSPSACCATCAPPSVASLIAAAHAITLTVPDAAAFTEPAGPPDIGAITLTDDGRLFGYLAPARVAHRGYPDRPVTVPMGNVDYTRWMCRPTITAGGQRIATGAVTMGCGHANTNPAVTSGAALEHYDNSCSIVATARVGENRHGVWIAGALLADVTPAQVARLLACQLSGDWRPNRERPGTRELVGVLAVPVPGFPMGHTAMRVSTEGGQLVASAVPIRHGTAPVHLAASGASNLGIAVAARILATATGRDRATRLAALRTRVKG